MTAVSVPSHQEYHPMVQCDCKHIYHNVNDDEDDDDDDESNNDGINEN